MNKRSDYCFYYHNGRCDVYNIRPIDCRFFPFDIMIINEKFFWIVWLTNCSISSKGKEKLELFLQKHEQELIPGFRENLENYAKFMPFLDRYQYKVLREIKL